MFSIPKCFFYCLHLHFLDLVHFFVTVPSTSFGNGFSTPKPAHKLNLKESFLTPREVKTVLSDSDDNSDTEINAKSLSNKNSSCALIEKSNSDIIEVSSDEEQVSSIFI